MMGEYLTPEGAHLAFTWFEASDGIKLNATSGDCDSARCARRLFDNEIHRASKVVERETKKDQTGKVIGVRARIVVRLEGSEGTCPALLWVLGSHFHEFISKSWEDILELEKTYADRLYP